MAYFGLFVFLCFVILILISLIVSIISFYKKRYTKGVLLLLPPLILFIIIILPDLLRTRECSEIDSSRASLRGVQSALELYYTHYKYYPENLEIPIKEGYLAKGGDKDPWKTPYKYERSPDKSNYLIGSAGEDNKFDTDDDVEPPINTPRHTFKKTIEVKK
ncbi:MAG: hypothetical protein A2231_09665 [Candidatus Firestonebacteria bacterium RIFOXYA2_FULL_40_8]|nr:MAG: hypothetical protein A2231_09665 [Candidatus Firestonebacteria bacterium RIFOXYA2_FULL_40_8]